MPRPSPEPQKSLSELMLESLRAHMAGEQEQKSLVEAQRDGDRIREECKTLTGFIGHAWHVLEPNTPLKRGWAMDAMDEHYEAIHYGHIKNLLTSCPPGLMKSLKQNVFFPAWEWGPMAMPWLRYVCTSYGLPLTNRDGRKFLRLINSPWYQTLWPDVKLTATAVDDLENSRTGIRIGVPWSKSMGKRGNRFMFDDPHDLENAENDDQREGVVRLWKEGATSRLNDPETDSFLGVMQRLHAGDMTGWILENDPSFTHLLLPQEFDPERRCFTYRKDGSLLFKDPRKKEGELLFPERYNQAYIDNRKKLIGAYAYNAQDQQQPTPRGGGLFQEAWFKERTVKSISDLPARIKRKVRGWDLAATDLKALQKSGARSAGTLLAELTNGEYAILGCVARGFNATRVQALMKATAKKDGRDTEISAPQDPAQAGKAQKAQIIKNLRGYDVSVTLESGDKVARFTPFSIQCEEGNVWIVEGPWTKEFMEEMVTFPNGKRKDIGDSLSRGFLHLTTKKKRGEKNLGALGSKLISASDEAEPVGETEETV